jgi:Outer membrane protein beta-barrel domain
MKRMLIFFSAFIISGSAFCQVWRLEGKETRHDRIRFGIKAGVVFANQKIKDNSTTPPGYGKPGSRLGFMGGGFAQIILAKNLCFQPELVVVGKGKKDQYNPYTNVLTYLELPLNLLYKSSTLKGSFFAGAGPAPAFYIGQNLFNSGYNGIKKFDAGINILTGYELPVGFSINLHYTYGVLNLSQNRTDIPVTKNRCFGISAAYTF